MSSKQAATHRRFVDIGANLLDERFTKGSYRGKERHEPDFDDVVKRAADLGMRHMILTAGTLKESREAVEKVRALRKQNQTECQIYCTVGVHPTRCNEFMEESSGSPEAHLEALLEIASDGASDGVIASVGEMGLDYDRLEFCSADVQKKCFPMQLQLAQRTGLPLFLHNRNVSTELYDLLVDHRSMWKAGVVHSFDDSLELAQKFIDLGLYIGLNGCSLKTEENLKVVKELPLEKILLETDCPYCDVKRTHAGFQYVKTHFEVKQEKKFERGFQVKGRNEPVNIIQVAEVVAGAKGIELDLVIDTCYQNSLRLYGWTE